MAKRSELLQSHPPLQPHEQAMEQAACIFAQLFCITPSALDPATCVFRNTYSIEIAGMPTAALIREPNPPLLSYVPEGFLSVGSAVRQSSEDARTLLRTYSTMLKALLRETVEHKRRVLLIGVGV
ncbi:hypothetical protein ETB97_006747 [Aspergillus alliaceus]|uniref:Uncharacterized protein n=1 Tax=Petromyces alliaceus TaxID=209559 RepID=A0A8H6E337_PETAA|nr:hypothetical protein ETB97_006747 [Aspergillus burnettii]